MIWVSTSYPDSTFGPVTFQHQAFFRTWEILGRDGYFCLDFGLNEGPASVLRRTRPEKSLKNGLKSLGPIHIRFLHYFEVLRIQPDPGHLDVGSKENPKVSILVFWSFKFWTPFYFLIVGLKHPTWFLDIEVPLAVHSPHTSIQTPRIILLDKSRRTIYFQHGHVWHKRKYTKVFHMHTPLSLLHWKQGPILLSVQTVHTHGILWITLDPLSFHGSWIQCQSFH